MYKDRKEKTHTSHCQLSKQYFLCTIHKIFKMESVYGMYAGSFHLIDNNNATQANRLGIAKNRVNERDFH